LLGEAFKPYGEGTLATNLGGLCKPREYLVFELLEGGSAASEISRMADMVANIGIPWMNSHQDLDSFIGDLKDFRFIGRDGALLRRPAAHFLNGDFHMVETLLSEGMNGLGDGEQQVSQWSLRYRRFADALRLRLPSSSHRL
jgi:hypothetical protein